ncbi:MAG: DUF2130 domain-containing protein [Betaproteobacteria bacterium]|nr:DUF2130 domain-containing protein [Betaproteobacteria bacterium]
MSDTTLTCPNCGHVIPLTEALTAQLSGQVEARLHAQYEARLKAAAEEAAARARGEQQLQLEALGKQLADQTRHAREAEDRELELKRRALDLEEQGRTLAERTRLEVEEKLRAEADEKAKTLVAQTQARARQEAALELDQLKQQLSEQQAKTLEAQKRELDLSRQTAELKQKQQELDLELERRLARARAEDEKRIRHLAAEEQSLKLSEKEKQIEDLRRVIDDLKRKSEQGSQELQGEVLELDIQAALERQFPHDAVSPVPKGVSGADLIQEVNNAQGASCGRIVWETKNTKHWSAAWLPKLKDDTRAVGGNLAVLVTTTLPEGIHEFGLLEGVWIASRRAWPALAVALREQLLQVAFAHAAGEGKHEKMEVLYRYLAGDQFRQKVTGIVEAFTALQDQLQRERRAMEKLWKEREKQIERVITNTVGMYGEMSGILGGSLPEIAQLSLEGGMGLLEGGE